MKSCLASDLLAVAAAFQPRFKVNNGNACIQPLHPSTVSGLVECLALSNLGACLYALVYVSFSKQTWAALLKKRRFRFCTCEL